ncbi:tetratricopeptide repeat protein [Halocola ammonii]
MRNLVKYFFIACLIALAGLVPVVDAVAQSDTDLELAEYYFNQGQYESAKLYYEKIYETNRTNRVYDNYLATLVALENFDEAEKLVKKKLRATRNKAEAYLDLGSLYKQFEEFEDANDAFEDALDELEPGRSNAVRLANEFIKLNEFDWAMKTYEKSKKITRSDYSFNYEIANLQGIMGNHDEMAEAFLDLLLDSPHYIRTVQNSLNRNLNVQENKENAEMLKTKLLSRTQKYPDATMYNEMLIWLFTQEKNFDAAFIQVRALDMRQGEDGHRMMNLANMALNNDAFGPAKKAYEYVVSKGKNGSYYIAARIGLLRTMKEEVTSNPGADDSLILELEQRYEETLAELGKSASTASLMKDLAHIKAFYLGKIDEAISILEEAKDLPGVYDKLQAVIKLELGDVLLLKGEIWDASLLYSQVEHDFKEDPLGHEAKFRNAKISYYTGDFEWAQAQLDVLKASTSKLISNDAIDLSLLITDNLALDTITEPMLMFAQADLLAYQNQTDEAIAKMDSIMTEWPGHSLTDDILMLKADIFSKRNNYEKAEEFLQRVIDFHFHDILADDAVFQLAEIYDYVYEDQERAKELYQQILTEFPGSLYAVEARKRFRQIRGDAIE